MHMDHVVLWVSDQRRALEFFVNIVGLEPERAEEFANGGTSFPSVRVSDTSIIDLMDASKAARFREFTGGQASGAVINHICLSMTADEYQAAATRLEAHGCKLTSGGPGAFGAQGAAERSGYFEDPDGNVVEIRHYSA